MSFAHPQFLLLLAAVPVAAVFVWLAGRRRARMAAVFPAGLRPAGRGLKNACFLAGLTLLALAAAGPRWGLAPQPLSERPARFGLVIALDCSRSMLARDLDPDRLGAAKAVALEVLAGLPDIEAGLVGFAGRAWLACPLTTDRASLAGFLDELSPEQAPLGGTSLAAALEASQLAASGLEAGAVLLFSDGETTLARREAANTRSEARPDGPPVLAVSVGGPVPVPVPASVSQAGQGGAVLRDAAGQPVLVGVDVPGLAAVSRDSGGRSFRLAPDAPDPAPAIVAAIKALRPSPAARTGGARPGDRSALFGLAGFALLLVDLASRPRRRAAILCLLALGAACPSPAQAWWNADRDRAGAATDQGLTAYAAGRDQDALDAFARARVFLPDRPELLYDLGVASYRLGRFDRARELFGRAAATATPPLRARALYNQGNAAYRLGDVDGAIALYEATLAVDPADADARANLDWLRRRKRSGQDAPQKEPGRSDQKHGNSPDPTAGQGTADRPGQAPAPQGRDNGAGDEPRPGQAAATPRAAGDPGPGQAAVPLAAPRGQKAGEKRAAAAGRADDPVLSRVPDLVGLPQPPEYGRPAVEKDW